MVVGGVVWILVSVESIVWEWWCVCVCDKCRHGSVSIPTNQHGNVCVVVGQYGRGRRLADRAPLLETSAGALGIFIPWAWCAPACPLLRSASVTFCSPTYLLHRDSAPGLLVSSYQVTTSTSTASGAGPRVLVAVRAGLCRGRSGYLWTPAAPVIRKQMINTKF
ncbi:hypothetical protein Hamer_G010632 [Homarus americanus]|uniref:Secreted protein n=1 Tax=Homarus americanus TaxID=6706 RepID=A0A8J5J629_HOMAM|nr:hypothetical protein Hamer_G010632 [Homarus americanus]